jgi:hypothetical protein
MQAAAKALGVNQSTVRQSAWRLTRRRMTASGQSRRVLVMLQRPFNRRAQT